MLQNSLKLSMVVLFTFGFLILGVTIPVYGQTSDTTPPVVTVPDDIVVQTATPPVPVTFSVSATDDTDGEIIPTCNYPSGFSFNVGTIDISCTAEDAAGNKTTKIFYITVTLDESSSTSDTTPPVVTVPSNMSVQSTDNNPVTTTFTVTATDDTDGTITPTCSPASDSNFSVGDTTVTCTVTDAAGNTTTESFTITVTYNESSSTSDTTPPVVTVPSNMSVQSTDNNPVTATFTVTATDDTDGTITPTCSLASGSDFPIGTTEVTCTATDAAGNSTTGSFSVTVTYTPVELGIASFVDTSIDPQSYVDRYNNESSYKTWFDDNYSQYSSIYEAVGLDESSAIPDPEPAIPDPEPAIPDPEPAIPDPEPAMDPEPVSETLEPKCGPGTIVVDGFCKVIQTNSDTICGTGTVLVNGMCQVAPLESNPLCGPGTVFIDGLCQVQSNSQNGGCLIATATYGTELAPQVQQLRELRDNTLLQTDSGTNFMNSFNQFYYSFSPYIADYERENPIFREAVKIAITPMVSSLSILNYVDIDSESEMISYGISVILLNIGMYAGIPAIVVLKARKFI